MPDRVVDAVWGFFAVYLLFFIGLFAVTCNVRFGFRQRIFGNWRLLK
ncbi:MAG: hypothetical protein Ct9H300mP8_11840 [Gammaproteobacteria bacterium]|nr:MAG: hypothetical protein Ct9H300mP8_11840 [Gammaproteobacteria bacterium]